MNLDEAMIDDGVQQYVQWGLATLGAAVGESKGNEFAFPVPEAHRALFNGAKEARLVYGPAAVSPETPARGTVTQAEQIRANDATPLPVDEEFLSWIIDRLAKTNKVLYAVPTLPAVRVHEISARLFQAYTVDGGTLHLSGCTLEDRPLLRQTWLEPDAPHPPRLVHRVTDPEGNLLSSEALALMGVNSLRPPKKALPQLAPDDVRVWSQAARNHAPQTHDAIPTDRPVVASIVWCQYAAGKIEFIIDDASAEVSFSGWARQLAAGLVEPPGFECPVTGIRSHAIAATDDGRITAREAIRECAQSGRRVLLNELKECEQTGQAVLPEFLATCPVSGKRILKPLLEPCRTCQQPVGPACLENGICSACRNVAPVRKDDPRMARVLSEYPRLDRWRKWRIAETSTSYVLVAAAFIKRLLVVVNKESLEVLRLATRNRFSSHWDEPPPTERQEYLQ